MQLLLELYVTWKAKYDRYADAEYGVRFVSEH